MQVRYLYSELLSLKAALMPEVVNTGVPQMVENRDTGDNTSGQTGPSVYIRAANRSIGSTTGCTITEKAPTRAFSWSATQLS